MKIKQIGHIENYEIVKCSGMHEEIKRCLFRAKESSFGIIFRLNYYDDYDGFLEINWLIPAPYEILIFQKAHPVNIIPYVFSDKQIPFKNIYLGCFLFQNSVFQIETNSLSDLADEIVVLHIKKFAYSENAKVKKLRQEVDVLEKIATEAHKLKRKSIPEEVKIFVYEQDEGKCVRCGSMTKLHFDHIIPHSKGGADSIENIQILCEACNLQKSDKIAF